MDPRTNSRGSYVRGQNPEPTIQFLTARRDPQLKVSHSWID